jgi:hypothetical protein
MSNQYQLHVGSGDGQTGRRFDAVAWAMGTWEHEHIREAVQRRLDEHPEKMRQRRETVEHPSAPSRPGWEQPIS